MHLLYSLPAIAAGSSQRFIAGKPALRPSALVEPEGSGGVRLYAELPTLHEPVGDPHSRHAARNRHW